MRAIAIQTSSWLRLVTSAWLPLGAALLLLPGSALSQEPAAKGGVNAGVYGQVENVHSPFAKVAQIVSPSVVYIEVLRGQNQSRRGPYDEFFHDFTPRGGWPARPTSGSGFVMDARGTIMTNNHVIDGAEGVTATFLNGDSYHCDIVGQDPRTDIAVVRIREPARGGKGFPALVLGDSDEIQVGDWAIAVGNPFGEQLAGTVTVGVISAKGRSDLNIMGAEIEYQDFIQTDASINLGNSGGPLVNIRGEVIGVSSAVNMQGQGIGFAIPINLAALVSQQLIDTGRVRRGFLGIGLAGLTRAVAEGNDWDLSAGILIQSVVPDSPADKAGLRPDDVIVEFEGRPVSNTSQFRLLVASTDVGKTVQLRVFRAGKYLDLKVTLSDDAEQRPQAPQVAIPSTSWLGIQVEDVAHAPVREQFGLAEDERGVVITEVEPGSPAAEQGLQPGTLILGIVNREVDGIEDYGTIRDELQDRRKPITLKIKEGGTVRYVVLRPRS
ncbi:MAG TPA: trypsin-like peptidase domain-containing protein [Candidatus Krumholzibacteria bacterium]|jgi:Do/DeqQ family serine protease|nr:trypsin-like peptidase domain-containing protein [Candidatus Krumholzibacteria bacterium]